MKSASVIARRILVVAICAGLAYWIAVRPFGAAQHVAFFGQAFSFLVLRCLGWAWSLPVGFAAGLGVGISGNPGWTFPALLIGELLWCAALLQWRRVHALWAASLLYWLVVGIPLLWVLLADSAGSAWNERLGLLLPLLSSQVAANFSVLAGDLVPMRAVRRRYAHRPRTSTLAYVQSAVLFVALMPPLVALDYRFHEHEALVAALYEQTSGAALDRAQIGIETWLDGLSTSLVNEAAGATPGATSLTPWPPFTAIDMQHTLSQREAPALQLKDDVLRLSRDYTARDAARVRRVTGDIPLARLQQQLPAPPASCRFVVEPPQEHRNARLHHWLVRDYAVGVRELPGSNSVLSISCKPPPGVAAAFEVGAVKGLLFTIFSALLALALVNMASLRVAGPLRRAFVSLAGTAGIRPAEIPGPVHAWLLAPRLLARLVTQAASQLRRDRLRMNELLRHQEELIHYAPMVLYTLTLGPRCTKQVSFVSSSIKRLLGWERSDFMRPGWWEENVHPDDLRQMVDVYEAAALRQQYQCEYRLRDADGGWRNIYDEGLVGRRNSDGTLQITGALLDITPIVEARERAIADSRLTTLGRLAAGVAHELKQPLNVIGMAASNGEYMLAALPLSEQQSASIAGKFRRIQDQVQRAARIVDQMGRTGRLASTTNAEFRLQDAIGAAVTLAESELVLSKIPLQLALSPDTAIVFGNQQMLEQALMNLFLNARDAMVSSRARRSADDGTSVDVIDVRLKVDRRLSRAQIEIVDTGGGAAPDVLQKMFEPFYTTKSVGKGMGLGLSIVYNTVSNLDGTIEARNFGRGLCITITLPLVDGKPDPA